jgi:hypothetical protein
MPAREREDGVDIGRADEVDVQLDLGRPEDELVHDEPFEQVRADGIGPITHQSRSPRSWSSP